MSDAGQELQGDGQQGVRGQQEDGRQQEHDPITAGSGASRSLKRKRPKSEAWHSVHWQLDDKSGRRQCKHC